MSNMEAVDSEHRISSITEFETVQKQTTDLLSVLDKTRVQYYHLIAVIVAGCGFFTDAYDLFCLSTVTNLLGRLYFYDPSSPDPLEPGKIPIQFLALLNSVTLFGGLAGSLFFGVLGDRLGRRKTYRLSLAFMILGSIGSGLSYSKNAKALICLLCFFRFWLGFGVGGDYPASATIMAEYANVKSRGAFLGAMFAMQGCGILSCAGMAILVAESFKKVFVCEPHAQDFPFAHIQADQTSLCMPPTFDTPKEADYVWRIILLVGAIPALLTLYFRTKLPETPRYTVLVAGDVKKARDNMNKLLNVRLGPSLEEGSKWKGGGPGLFSRDFVIKFGWRLVATSCTYFLVDLAFYSQTQFQKDVLADVGWLPPPIKMDGLREVSLISQAMAIMALLASVPGYWVTVCTVDWLGRRAIQLQGFFFLSVICLIIGFKFYDLRGEFCDTELQMERCDGHPMIFIGLYGAMFFFFNFGANTTTFILAAELFPARLRSTCIGISVFLGKLGALCGTFGFMYVKIKLPNFSKDSSTHSKAKLPGFEAGYLLLACSSAVGFVITFFLIPETTGQSLEVLTFEETSENLGLEPCHENTVSPDHLVNV